MRIECTGIEPGGNRTLLVTSPVDRTTMAGIGKYCVEQCNAGIEQVGFLSDPQDQSSDVRIDMMGGEFCLNAVRSAAFYLFTQGKPPRASIQVSCSGATSPITCISNDWGWREGHTRATMHDVTPEIERIAEHLTLVHLPGISHFLHQEPDDPLTNVQDKGIVDFRRVMDSHGKYVDNVPAFGVIFHKPHHRGIEIKPIVAVRATDTIVEETGCASGSAALLIALCADTVPRRIEQVIQPPPKDGHRPQIHGAAYTVEASPHGNMFDITLESQMRVLFDPQSWLVPPMAGGSLQP